ncbi:MAG: hypothetical protein ABGW87_12680 [Sphingomonadaceae bacterium]
MVTQYQRRCERNALIDWSARDGYTHAITLNTDRELSLSRLKDICGTFCHLFDKRVHGIRNMGRFPIELRLRAILFPENLLTNAHLHGFADFAAALDVLRSELQLEEVVRGAWLTATRGAGSIYMEPEPDSGWARYATKKYDRTFFLAADFHPQ